MPFQQRIVVAPMGGSGFCAPAADPAFSPVTATPATLASSGGVTASRDERLDLLRGACVLKMIHAHGAATVLQPLLLCGAFVDAAEGFFVLSGVVLGMLGQRRLAGGRGGEFARKLLRRAAWLWAMNTLLAIAFGLWDLLGREMGFFHFGFTYRWMFSPANGGWHWHSVLLFDYPYYLYILPRYVAFLAAAPAALWLMGRLPRAGAWLVLGLSAALWAAEQVPGVTLLIPHLEVGLPHGFRISAWQLPFFLGLVIGHERHRLGGLWRWLTRPGVLLLLALTAAVLTGLALARWYGWIGLSQQWDAKLFDKETMGVVRVVNGLVLYPLVYWLADRCWNPICRAFGWLLLPLGRRALMAFLLHVPLLYALRAASDANGWTGPLATHTANLLLVAGVCGAAVWAERRATEGRRSSSRAAPAIAPTLSVAGKGRDDVALATDGRRVS